MERNYRKKKKKNKKKDIFVSKVKKKKLVSTKVLGVKLLLLISTIS